MEDFIYVFTAILAIIIIFFITCVVISACRYFAEELNHTFKNFKRSAREFVWDMEWKLRHH